MANNLFADVPAAVVAKVSASFSSLGLTSSNIRIIYEVGNPLKSWIPGRSINAITGFTEGKGYYIVPSANIDLESAIIPPIPESGSNITPPAPTSGVVDDTANTFAYTLASGYSLSDHEQSTDGGSTYGAASNPVSVGDVTKAAGQIKVRVKAATGRNAGPALSNATGFNAATGGGTWVDVDFTGQAIEPSPNVWTGTAGGDAYTSQAIGNKSLPASTDGALRAQRKADSNGNIFGFKESNSAGLFSEIMAGFTITADGTVYKCNNGGLALVANPGTVAIDDYVQVIRTGSAFKLQHSTDGTTWTDFGGGLGNLTYSSSAQLFAAAALDGSAAGKLTNPQGLNVV